MRIRYKIMLVGGVPIAIAAVIAIAAWFLLAEASRARGGAVLTSTIYRDLVVAMASRDDFINAQPSERNRHYDRFGQFTSKAEEGLAELSRTARDPQHIPAIAETKADLALNIQRMSSLQAIAAENDRLVAEMRLRAASLIALTDRARERQQASNGDIVKALTDGDRKLRAARDIADHTQAVRAALDTLNAQRAGGSAGKTLTAQRSEFALLRLQIAASQLSVLLGDSGQHKMAEELDGMITATKAASVDPDGLMPPIAAKLADWCEKILKIYDIEQRALHEEVAQMFTYSVQAHETEQATQNIAIATLKLERQADEALTRRDPDTTAMTLRASADLAERIGSLPISPLIQSEMIDAVAAWRLRLATTTQGLERQKQTISDMDAAASSMLERAKRLNDSFTDSAEATGDVIKKILASGATIGLLFGSIAAFVVAKSITTPLNQLQARMVELAADPGAGRVAEIERRDELGDMARATNNFVVEIAEREHALRTAKDRAQDMLAQLQQTQAELVQSEKLASLGQLVAGVAHEINTPIGVALTTASVMGDEARLFSEAAASGRIERSQFARLIERMTEGSRLLAVNLSRAADLVHSFKQVAADQTSGERRRFEMKPWLNELMTSLGPVLRKAGHAVRIDCRDGLDVDTFPGALAQVLTNLVMNAVVHAFPDGAGGVLELSVSETQSDMMRLVFEDNGRGIGGADLGKVFDPFFTTRRQRGSTGLGLHIVYNLVTGTLQGRIDIDSALGRGTRFTIDLPRVVAATRTAAEPSNAMEMSS